jgi:hypothetical protein
MGFPEIEKAHTRPFSSCMGFSMSRYRAGGLFTYFIVVAILAVMKPCMTNMM